MRNSNPIIIIDDDEDDSSIIQDVLLELGIKNRVISFVDPRIALTTLAEMNYSPFVIICDVNMPAMNGFELRKEIIINKHLLQKSTPFIFLSTSNNADAVNKAYTLNIQGYFTKPNSYVEFLSLFKKIIAYWDVSISPTPA